MYIITVTGGLAAGKGVACDYFHSRGAVVIDLDDVARRLLVPGHKIAVSLTEEFGEEILGEDGSIDRARLAKRAFADDASTSKLNKIVHPAVASEVLPGLTEMGLLQNPPRYVVLDVPMLVEAPVYVEMADVVVAIFAPEEIRVARAVDRGMDEADARARIARQATESERQAIADTVIENATTREEFLAALERFWDEVVEGVT